MAPSTACGRGVREHVEDNITIESSREDVEDVTRDGLDMYRPAGVAVVSVVATPNLDASGWHVRVVLDGGLRESFDFEVNDAG